MPHTPSAKKNLRKSSKRRLHNRAAMSAIRTQVKKVLAALKAGSVEEARKEFRLVAKRLDKAAARRIIHPNLASRKKARLSHAINGIAAKTNLEPRT